MEGESVDLGKDSVSRHEAQQQNSKTTKQDKPPPQTRTKPPLGPAALPKKPPNSLTFANRALKKLLTRNLNRSSSVWKTINLKFVLGSIDPVCSSTTPICRPIRPMTRPTSSSGQASSSGAARSATQARESECRSAVSDGTASRSRSARMSSMSMAGFGWSRYWFLGIWVVWVCGTRGGFYRYLG
jgi:hypothetical protein